MPSSKVFSKFKHGKLHSGSKKGPVVTNRKQAQAIFMSEKEDEAEGNSHGPREEAMENKKKRRMHGSMPLAKAYAKHKGF